MDAKNMKRVSGMEIDYRRVLVSLFIAIAIVQPGARGQSQACSPLECNENDRCEACPGCAYMDYSCSGGMCQPSYMDPDSQRTYCDACNLTWSGTGEQKNCCGDDRNEYWVSPCAGATGMQKCCNRPDDRVDANGNCVGSCGMEIKVNITEMTEKPIGMAITILPDAIDIEPGGNTEFKVYLKTDWNESLHNVSIIFCKEYDFQVDPPSIPELRTGEIRYFTVKMHAPLNSTLGKKDFEVYVAADEFLNRKQKNATLTVGKVDYTIYYIYSGIIIAIVLALVFRKFLAYREKVT